MLNRITDAPLGMVHEIKNDAMNGRRQICVKVLENMS
jgi:hypothetical protein